MAAGKAGYIHLEPHHPIVEDVVASRLKQGAQMTPMDIKIADFDDIAYELQVDNKKKNILLLNVTFPYIKELKSLGANRVLQKQYAPYMKNSPQKGFDLSFEMDSTNVADPVEVSKLMSLLKRNIFAAPLEDAFDALIAGTSSKMKPCIMRTRKEEQIIIQPQSDRVNCFFSISFAEEQDSALAEIFMQEYADANRQVQNSPSCKFSRDVPQLLRKMKGIIVKKDTVGFLAFSILKTHVDNGNRDKVVTLLLALRQYLHYHIKASKAYLHVRMRKKVSELLLVLNQAVPQEESKKKKTYRKVN